MKDSKGMDWTEEQAGSLLKNLLGSLELEVMHVMWQTGQATVKQVVDVINHRRPIAYTTVMTVMAHLTDKGLLRRTKEGKRYCYRIAQTKEQYLYQTSRNMVRSLVSDFGDLAIASFLGEVGDINAKRLEQLRKLIKESGSENLTSQ